jgi:hypothetical protein
MGNTVGTANGSIIAQRALETLLETFPMLRQISTDFSAEAERFNQTVISTVVVPGSAKDYHDTNGYVEDDRTNVDVPITINKFKHHTYGVTDKERTANSRDLIELYARTSAHALGKQMVDDLFAIVLAANFAEVYDVTPENFDRDDVVNIRRDLNVLKVPDVDRFMVLNSEYHPGLAKDLTVVANAGSGADTVKTGRLPMVDGFSVSEYSALPHNGENLAGIAGNKEALVIATRVPELPKTQVPGRISIVTEPNTGLSIQLREWYDMTKGKEFRTMTLMYGVAVGLTNTAECKRLIRIRNQ